MALYSIPVTISATLYVHADSAKEALRMAKERGGFEISLGDTGGDVPVSEAHDDPRAVTLAPDATFQGPDDGERATNLATGLEEA